MKIRRLSWLCLGFAILIAGCEGDQGPAGPEGSANVVYSDWYSPTWTAQTTFDVAERAFTMTTSSLTQEIVDQGVIMVYMRFVGFNPQVNQLPVTLADVHLAFLFRAQAGSIEVAYYSTTTPGATPVDISSGNVARYVLIPGAVLDTAAKGAGITGEQLTSSLESMAYEEVCDLFDIPE